MNKYALVLLVLGLSWGCISTGKAQSATTDIKEACRYEWNCQAGNPCKIVVLPERMGGGGMRRTYYFTNEGKLFAILLEHLDSPDSYRPLVSSTFYALDENMEVVGTQCYNYNWGDRGKVDTVFRQYNNYALSRADRVRLPKIMSVETGHILYSPEDRDARGNWLKGAGRILYDVRSDIYCRKIYYYGEASKEEKEVAEVVKYYHSVVDYCKENGWSASERAQATLKESHGMWWNFLVPLMLGTAFGLLPSLLLVHRTKFSNLNIFILNIVFALTVGIGVANLIISIGPYGALWEFLFWVIAVLCYLISLSVSLYKRCPKCASYDCSIVGRAIQSETETEVVTKWDGSKEMLSRHTDHTTIETLRCNNCGHTWKAYWNGIIRK